MRVGSLLSTYPRLRGEWPYFRRGFADSQKEYMTKRKNGTTEGRKANWKRTKTMAMSIKTDYQRSLCGNTGFHRSGETLDEVQLGHWIRALSLEQLLAVLPFPCVKHEHDLNPLPHDQAVYPMVVLQEEHVVLVCTSLFVLRWRHY
jgi:hypothetical protein